MTIQEALREAVRILDASPQPMNSRQDAELLMTHILNCDKAYLWTHSKDELPATAAEAYWQAIEERAECKPIQYITGQQEFYGLPFVVRPGVLIPRPETEHLVEAALTAAKEYRAPRILDIGCGSGIIAVTLAHHVPNAAITATDLSPVALAISMENAEKNNVDDRIRFLRADLMAGLEDEEFDIIVSNPPYVSLADRETLSLEVREYEPEMALFAGTDGLNIYRQLIPTAYQQLAPAGWLLLEIGFGQSEAVRALLEESGFGTVVFHPDLQGIPRVAEARKP